MATLHENCIVHTQEQAPISAYLLIYSLTRGRAFFIWKIIITVYQWEDVLYLHQPAKEEGEYTELVAYWEKILKPNPSNDHS